MAIRNINTIQNPKDLSYILTSYTNDYMYESLSNLGQRFSVKGDSIVSNYFTTLSLLNKTVNDLDADVSEFISKISIDNNKLFLKLLNKNDIHGEPIASEEIKYSINNLLVTDTPLTLNIKINGIDYYKENMYIYCRNNVFTICSLGCDNEIGIVELNIETYNIVTNTLIQSMKLIDVNDDDFYYLYNLYDETKLENDTDIDYRCSKYKIKKQYILTNYNSFNNYALSIYNNIIKEYYEEYSSININKIFSEILQHGFVNALPNLKEDVIVTYNDSYAGFYVEGEYGPEFNAVLTFIYNQWMYMYDFIFKYYNNYIYKLDNNQLNKYILYSIFNNSFIESGLDYIHEFEMYIPIDYEFNYYCKDTDKFYIYSNETPINILYTLNKLTQKFIDDIKDTMSLIICSHTKFEKVVLYNFNINYNVANTNNINSISVSELYATPYIVGDYWCINGMPTSYKAIGENAGNPNIIIVYSHGGLEEKENRFYANKDFTVLTSINTELLNKLQWEKRIITSDLLNHIDLSNTQYVKEYNYNSYLLIPVVEHNHNIQNELKNSIIINLSDIDNVITKLRAADDKSDEREKSEIKQILGNNSFITSFWVFKDGKFEYISNPQVPENVLTLSNLHSTNAIIARQTSASIEEKFNKLDMSEIHFTYSIFNTGYVVSKNYLDSDKLTYATLYNDSTLQNIDVNNVINNPNTFNNPFIFTMRYIDKLNLYNTITIGNSKPFINTDDITNDNLYVNTSNVVTAYTIKDINIEDKSKYYNDYLPAHDIPLFNIGEVFTMNLNTANKTGINVFDSNGSIYYSYIGTSLMDPDKSVLHIGTSNINGNIGIQSLIDSTFLDKFKKMQALSIDFNKIELNAKYTYTNEVITKIDDIIEASKKILYKLEDESIDIIYDSANGVYDVIQPKNEIVEKVKTINLVKGNSKIKLDNIVAIPVSLIIDEKNILLNDSESPIIRYSNYDFIITNKASIGGNKYIAKFDIVYNTINDTTAVSIKDHNKCILPIKFKK